MTKLSITNEIRPNDPSLLDEIIEQTEPLSLAEEQARLPSIQLARLVSYSEKSVFIVLNEIDTPILALSLAPIVESDIGKICAIQFINGNKQNPLIMGLIQQNNHSMILPETPLNNMMFSSPEHGQLHIQASESITLQCGESSLTLTADGFVQIKALYIDNYASATNRIKGGSVQVN
ncbi:DUF6484 domain-containing protein [Providencia hangzhouensis]|nr:MULTISPECIES: DUF6484 domain-containing protein [Providencia]MBJ9970469.1 hypothetical protein [Providencia rettgeri]MCF8962073.1 hypothetical protein [Providencia rettgeri]TNV05309.1 hypothetical protein FH869_02335 [Providencia rettgeri]UDQ66144.1 DUF6484 domain-containing protein [Providencia rettgeri]WOB98445.1 DUF6484 domain-containing protein [Providencia sp. PROV046]